MARVCVSDEVWADFRAAAGERPLSEVLGDLVDGEVRRYRARRIRDGLADDAEVIAALASARELRTELDAIIAHLERRHGSALDVDWDVDV